MCGGRKVSDDVVVRELSFKVSGYIEIIDISFLVFLIIYDV